jgi:hypothetical protein
MSSILFCDFCGQKDSMRRIFIKKFPVYDGKCLSRKVVHNWVDIFSAKKKHLGGKYFADDEEVETEVRKWLRRQSKGFYVAGFDALVKQWDK